MMNVVLVHGQYAAGLLGAGMSSPDEEASLVTKLQGYTEGYYQLAIYALIAGLLLIVVSPLIRKLMQEVTNINQILLYVYNNYRRSLKQKSFGHPVGLFILFLTEMWSVFHIMG
jgi:dipeptide/tripeptide permease